MIRTRFAAAMIPALMLPAALAWSPRLAAQEAAPAEEPALEASQEVGESPERYAQVKVVEGSVTIRKGELDEPLSRGIPVAEGDVVESHGRGVLQLGDGSAVAFGGDTRFRVAALFSDQNEVRRVLLVLERGQLRVRKGAQSDAILRVDTPSGSGTLGNRGTAATRPDVTFTCTTDLKGDTTTLMVHGGQVSVVNGLNRIQLFAGQRLTVYGKDDTLNRVADINTYSLDSFDLWAAPLVTPNPSASASRVPEEIRYYTQDLDTNGRWVYVDDCSTWCWTPSAVAEDWRPYCYGRWGAYGGGMTWISDEPWGYVTYHHGRWGWGRGIGWYWIPGIYYSPAWVAWNCCGSDFGWAPLGFYNRPCRWGYGPWAGGYCWNVVGMGHIHDRNLRNYYQREPGALRIFSGSGTGHGWWGGRMVVNNATFHDSARFQQVASHPGRDGAGTFPRASQPTPTGHLNGQTQMASNHSGFTRLERPEGTSAPRPVLRPLAQARTPMQGAQRSVDRSAPVRSQDNGGRHYERTPAGERPRSEPRYTSNPYRSERRDAPAPRQEFHAAPRSEDHGSSHAETHSAPRSEAHSAPRSEGRSSGSSGHEHK